MKHLVHHLSTAIFMLLLAACTVPAATQTSTSASSQQASSAEDRKLQVVTTVSPIANIVANIGGDHIDVIGIVPEGVNSHTFEPAPSDARRLADADLIIVNGLDLEEPTIRMAEANKRDGVEILSLGEQTVSPNEYVFDFSFPVEAGSPNPHLWMNPLYALRYAELTRDALSELDPANAADYVANYGAFSMRIQALDKAIQETISTIPEENRRLLTYHDSFAYFAPRYGMTVIGAIQPADFSEPSARDVADLITQLRDQQIPAIFGSEVFPSPVLDQISREAGAIFIDTLSDDDLPGEPGDPDHSYFGMMVENVVTMTNALGGDPSPIIDFDTSNVTEM
ncbi:MAG: zinc ABC transporter substrate-binding protein [Caldilineaceae bacterium]|nr:zinc ABC transporter substrate-binding protein [Caldilineaceae bacterium]